MENCIKEIQNQFSAYAKTAIKNTRIHYLKKMQRTKEHEVAWEYPEESGEGGTEDMFFQVDMSMERCRNFDGVLEIKLLLDQISSKKLFQALVALSTQQKNIISLRFFYEKSFAEIGWILGISRKEAENTYFNTIKKIRRILGRQVL